MTAATVRKQKNNKATAKFVVCGFIPGCEMVLETVGREPYTTLSQQPDEMQKILEFLVKVDKTKKSVQKFLDTYSSWLKKRQGCIENIRKLADSIDFHHRNTNIATATCFCCWYNCWNSYDYWISFDTRNLRSITWPHCNRSCFGSWCNYSWGC